MMCAVLFAGAGRARIGDTDKIVPASPLIALGVPDKFDRYVFCEAQAKPIQALEQRVHKAYPEADVHYVHGDSNAQVDDVLAAIPARKSLTFCVVDPFSTTALAFNTIRRLSERRTDFFVLIASYMDANRNEATYVKEGDERVAHFLGDAGWRDRWIDARDACGARFGSFIVARFGEQMKQLRYLAGTPVTVRLCEKNVRLYHLAFYSRHELGIKFWDKARKSTDDQTTLFKL